MKIQVVWCLWQHLFQKEWVKYWTRSQKPSKNGSLLSWQSLQSFIPSSLQQACSDSQWLQWKPCCSTRTKDLWLHVSMPPLLFGVAVRPGKGRLGKAELHEDPYNPQACFSNSQSVLQSFLKESLLLCAKGSTTYNMKSSRKALQAVICLINQAGSQIC